MEKLINEFSFGLFFWQLFLFIGLLILLNKFAWKPILTAINEREEEIRKSMKEAEQVRKENQDIQESNRKIMQEARAEGELLLAKANKSATETVNKAKEQAKVEANKIIEEAQTILLAEKKEAIKDLKNQVASFSIEIAEKVIKSELSDKKAQEEFVSKMVSEINTK